MYKFSRYQYGSINRDAIPSELESEDDVLHVTPFDRYISVGVIVIIMLYFCLGISSIAVGTTSQLTCDSKFYMVSLSQWLVAVGIVDAVFSCLIFFRICLVCKICHEHDVSNPIASLTQLICDSSIVILLVVCHTLYSFVMITIGIINLIRVYEACRYEAVAVMALIIIVLTVKMVNIAGLSVIMFRYC